MRKNGFGWRVGGKKESARTSSMSRKEKNCAEAFHLHQGQGNPQLEADDTTELSVETALRLAHRLRARHPDRDGVENVWNEERMTESVVATVGQRICPLRRVRVGTRAAVGRMPWL